MLQNPDLIQHFVWDACQLSRFSKKSGSWVRFFDEPWTADQFWKIQVCANCPVSCVKLTPIWKVKPSTGSKTTCSNCLCRQIKAIIIWHQERLPCHCTVCKSSCRITKWNWPWRWPCCWVAPSGVLQCLLHIL